VQVQRVERGDWRKWVKPTNLEAKPIHRWFVFPHSFSAELVDELIDEWSLTGGCVLDPFVGAGTTVVAARERGVGAVGIDISPLAVFITNAKARSYKTTELHSIWREVRMQACKLMGRRLSPGSDVPDLLSRAFSPEVLAYLLEIRALLHSLQDQYSRDFFTLGLLAVLKDFSKLVGDGGWLRKVDRSPEVADIFKAYDGVVNSMLDDISQPCPSDSDQPDASWYAVKGDARRLDRLSLDRFDGVITSPPYPNRHDYTRIFSIELLFDFVDSREIKELRYQTFQSHVESKPKRVVPKEYVEPKVLENAVNDLMERGAENRIIAMLKGYALDLYLTLSSMRQVIKPGAPVAFVVGNVRYNGVMVLVDEMLVSLGLQLGYGDFEVNVARRRGNSAQQMRDYKKAPARESVVIMKAPL